MWHFVGIFDFHLGRIVNFSILVVSFLKIHYAISDGSLFAFWTNDNVQWLVEIMT